MTARKDPGTGGVKPPSLDQQAYMSYSRMNSILTCGEQFRLERVLKMPSREHWASVGGNAMHTCIERLLKAEMQHDATD